MSLEVESEEKCLERNGWNFLTPEEPATWGAPPCLDVEEFVVDKDAASIRDAVTEHGVAFAAYSPLGHISQVEVLGQPKVQAVAARLGRSPAQVAMRWLVQQGIPVVTGTANPAHAKEALDLFGWRLSDKDMRELAAI